MSEVQQDATIQVYLNGEYQLSIETLPGEDQGFETHEFKIDAGDLQESNEVTIHYEEGNGTLILGECEIDITGPTSIDDY